MMRTEVANGYHLQISYSWTEKFTHLSKFWEFLLGLKFLGKLFEPKSS